MPSRSWLLLLALAIIVGGCSRSPVVPVTGTITFEGREAPQVCRLSFVPMDSDEGAPIRPNGAEMQPDGSFRMSPHQGVEGLLPGRYSIRVNYFDLKKGGNPGREGDWVEQTHDAGELLVEPNSNAIDHQVVVP